MSLSRHDRLRHGGSWHHKEIKDIVSYCITSLQTQFDCYYSAQNSPKYGYVASRTDV